jgi:hypothetical protein
MQTKQQATLESMDGKLPALVNGALPITDVTADVLISASLTTSGAVGTVGTGATKANAEGSYTVVIDVTGTWVGTISFYQTIDQALYYPIKGGLTTGGGEVSSTTTNGEFVFNSGGFKEIWAVMTSYTSGTATVKLNSSIAQQGVSATVSGSSAVGTAPAKPPVSVSGVDAGGLKRALSLDTTGAIILSQQSAQPLSTNSLIIQPQTTYLIQSAGSGSGNSVTAKINPGGAYSFAISLPSVAVAAVVPTITAGVLGDTTILCSNTTGLAVGQHISGTGFALGCCIVSIIANTSFVISIPLIAGSTTAPSVIGGSFQVEFEGSTDNSTFYPITVSQKSVPSMSQSAAFTNRVGLYVYQADLKTNFIRARLSSLTSLDRVHMFIDAFAPNNLIHLPFISGVAANVPVNTSIIPVVDLSDISEVALDLTITGSTLTWRQSSDPLLITPVGLPHWFTSVTPNTTAVTCTATGAYRLTPRMQYFAAVNNAVGTSTIVNGAASRIGPTIQQDTTLVTASNLSCNLAQVAGTTALNGGIVGSLAIGGTTGGGVNTTGIQNFATTAQNPLTIAGIDSFNQVHRVLTDSTGQQSTLGSGEIVNSFSLSAAAATVVEGTNSKTMVVPPVDGIVELDFVRCATSCQVLLEVTYGQNLWEVIPAQRVDLTATTFGLNNQIISGTNTFSFLPTNQSKWRAKVAGALGVRIHQVVGTTNETVGLFRFIPVSNNEHGSTSRSFVLGAASLTESFGAASSGIVALTAGTRTLLNPLQGGAKLRITADGFVSTNSTGIVQLTPEGSLDLATASGGTWYTMPLANLTGGFYSSSFIQLTTADTAIFEADASPFKMVRLRESGVSTGQSVTFGSMKIAPLSKQQVLSGFGASTQASATTADVSFFATNPYRKLAIVQNETTVPLFVLTIPGTASTSNYNVQLASGDVLNLSSPGPIRGFFTATTGTARLTEQY